jgi:DNA-3-methyladenine glycosylase II
MQNVLGRISWSNHPMDSTVSKPATIRRSEVAIAVREPFDLGKTLRFILSPPQLLNGRKFEPLLDHWEDGEYRRVADLAGVPVLYGVRESRNRGRANLQARIVAGPDDDRTLKAIAGFVERQFSADLDISPFYLVSRRDPALAGLVQHFRGMRIPQSANIFETLVSAILEQQINLSFAHQVKKALVQAFGSFIEHEGRRYYCFPEPAALAITTPRELLRLQISGPKAKYIIALSQAVLDGTLDLEGLRRLDPAAANEKLLAFKGVGPWTAQYLSMRALGHLDSLPAGDVGLQKAIMQFYGLRKQPSPQRVVQIARAWAGWRSYATFYLWLTFWEEREWHEAMIQQIRQARKGAMK